jgi:hypothetical protein
MGLQRKWILAVAFFSFSSCPAFAQSTEKPTVIPNTATVQFRHELRLHYGEEFPFQVTLSPAPILHPDPTQTGFRVRRLTAIFKRVGGPIPKNIDDEDPASDGTSTILTDNESIYNMSFKLPPWKLPGRWRLDSVIIDWRGAPPLRIVPDDVSFEMLDLEPISFQIDHPPSVVAGQPYRFTVTLDKPSDIYGNCFPNIGAQLTSGSANNFEMDEPGPILGANQITYHFSIRFETDEPGGPRQVTVSESEIAGREKCGDRKVSGDRTFTFMVEPAKGTRLPTSAAINVNPDQIQLLKGEADRLKAEADQIKAKIDSNSMTTAELRDTLQNVLAALTVTEAKYVQKGSRPSDAAEAKIFFGDIRRTYENARNTLTEKSERRPAPGYENAAFVQRLDHFATPNPASDAVHAAILHNVAAYEIVISTEHMVFSLEVHSVPDDATVYYRGALDDHETKLDHHTDWFLPPILARATYYIRCHKDGYDDVTETFDAQNDKRTSITLKFDPKAGRK